MINPVPVGDNDTANPDSGRLTSVDGTFRFGLPPGDHALTTFAGAQQSEPL